MDHEEAINRLTDHLLRQSLDQEVLEAVEQHISSCPDCMSEMQATIKLVREVMASAGRTLSCDECLSTLPEIAGISEEKSRLHYPLAWNHLDQCPNCKDVFSMMMSLEQQSCGNDIATFPLCPDFGQAFKANEEAQKSLWVMTENCRRLNHKIKAIIQKGLVKIVEFPLGSNRSELCMVVTARDKALKPGDNENKYQAQEVTIPDNNLCKHINFTLNMDEDGAVDVTIELLDDETGNAVEGVEITLFDAERVLLENGRTGKLGKVIFSNVQSADYVLQLSHEDVSWEVPLELKSAAKT